MFQITEEKKQIKAKDPHFMNNISSPVNLIKRMRAIGACRKWFGRASVREKDSDRRADQPRSGLVAYGRKNSRGRL